MKNIFAKKTIKILTIAVFSVFILMMFNISPAYGVVDSVVETTENNGDYEIKKIITVYQDESGREITRTEEIPTYSKYGGGAVSESYTNSSGTTYTRSGYIYEQGRYSWNTTSYLDDSGNKEIVNTVTDNKENTDNKFTFTLLQPLPTESGEFLNKNVTLKQYLTWAYKFVLALTGFLAVMMIVIGGVEYIISGANESMRGEAHKRITGAITGLVLALVAYLVLYTINPSLVNFEDNWFFKPRNTQMQNQIQNSKTTQTNSNINQGVQNMKDLKFDEKVMQGSSN